MKNNELTKLTPSKSILPSLADKLTKDYFDGHVSAVDLTTKFDFIIKALSEAKSKLKEASIREIQDGETEINGYKLEVSEMGVRYNFKNCNDPVYDEASKNMEEITKIIKDREKFLKAVPYEGMVITDQETGETCKVYPPAKSSSTSIKLTLQKEGK